MDLAAFCASHRCSHRGGPSRLVGQKASYTAGRLRGWRGDPDAVDVRKPHLTMPVIARRIPEDMIEPLARYFEHQ